MISGFVGLARGARLSSKLGLAIVFASGWFLLYNVADAAISHIGVGEVLMQRYLEIPVTAFGLFNFALFTRRRNLQPLPIAA